MKTTLITCCFALGCMALQAQDTFKLTVKMGQPIQKDKLFLFYMTRPGTMDMDSAACVNGVYTIEGKTSRPQRAYMYLAQENRNFRNTVQTLPGTPIYLEKGNIWVEAPGYNFVGTIKRGGTRLNDELQAYHNVVDPFDERYKALNQKAHTIQYRGTDKEKAELRAEFAQLAKEREAAEQKYFREHLDSEIALDWLQRKYNIMQEKTTAEKYFAMMSDRVKNTYQGKRYQRMLAETKSVEAGNMAPDFSAKNLKGEEVSLKTFRGKYVLLDFWASWCGPCRAENPNVLKAYNAFKDKNFTVLGFSIDDNEDAWRRAVKNDNLPWMQLSDLVGGQSPIARLYGVEAIPSNFLIDPNGKIIAQNLRGAELEKKLAEVLK